MTKKEFESFLDAKSRETKPQNKFDWQTRKNEWLESIQDFYENIDDWLKDYLDGDKITMEKEEVVISEENIGKYRAESRVIEIGADRVFLRPIGTQLIGTRGRIDMEGPKGTVKFILGGKDSNVWQIATPPPRVEFIKLTTESFLQSLIDVING